MKTFELPYSGLRGVQDDEPLNFPTLEITENGKYNVRGYDFANVNVEGGGTTVEALNVTENGTYSEEGKAYSPVVVNVPSDFKKAVITLICSGGEGYTSNYVMQYRKGNFAGACHIDNETGISSEVSRKTANYGTPQEVDLYLYNDNEAVVAELNADPTGAYTITGNAEIVNEEGHYFVKVTGDATISTVGSNK